MTTGRNLNDAFPQQPGWRGVATPWELARLETRESTPTGWIPAIVPGAVQLDWARVHGWPDLNFGENVRAYEGLEDCHWLYRTRVPDAARAAGEQLVFAGAGVDYACEVRVAGRPVLCHEGLGTPFEVDVSACPPGTDLEILILPAPKRHASPADRTQASHVCKPAVSYGWDWHPRLIPLGLCTATGFLIRPVVHLARVDFAYTLSEDLARAFITVTAEASDGAAACRWRLLDAEGCPVVETTLSEAVLPQPRLWWTHDHGEPSLYTLEVALDGGDTHRRRVGFRRVRLVMAEDGWKQPAGFPVSRNHPPITVELNGRVIFARGSNWVNSEIFPGTISADTVRPLLQLAREAHFNLLRCWGGAGVNPEAFFDQCDQLGLLVWQEFPLSCNNYPDDPAYLRILDQEARAIIHRLRQHPCLGLWCGGNELFNAWSGMTDQARPLRLLNRNCYDLDPGTPFIPTAPLEGMGHGDYRFRDDRGREVFEIYPQAACTAYTEFGVPGPSPVAYLKSFIPPAELWPPHPGTSWQTHHAFNAWEGHSSTWLCLDTQEHYFGPPANLTELVARGEWLQSEGCRAIFEEARRQKPRCAMALNWCYNEPWPSAANNSIINWPAQPKPAYFAVQSACRPVLVSARFAKFQWAPGEMFSVELWLLNDAPGDLPGGEVKVLLLTGTGSTVLGHWTIPAVRAGANLPGPKLQAAIPSAATDSFALVLQTKPVEWSSTYRLSLRSDASVAPASSR